MEKKNEKQLDKTERPFGLEFLETVPDHELESVTAAFGGVHTMHVSIYPVPDFG